MQKKDDPVRDNSNNDNLIKKDNGNNDSNAGGTGRENESNKKEEGRIGTNPSNRVQGPVKGSPEGNETLGIP